jgi:peptidoglycan/LPS O-acetylase OafA/YrhL
LTLAFSVYLDLIRFLASLGVFVDHLSADAFSKGLLNAHLGRYGNVSVMIFFLLSGYVIAFVTSTRERCAKDYTIARFARLYSVVAVALLLTYVFDAIGMHANPKFYANPDVLPAPPSWMGYLSSLSFVQQFQMFGRYGICPGTNQPFWSLSFEATYYVVAGLAMFAPRKISYPLSLLLLGVAGVRIAILLPIWGLGYFLFTARERIRLGTRTSLVIFPVSAAVILLAPRLFPRNPANYNL